MALEEHNVAISPRLYRMPPSSPANEGQRRLQIYAVDPALRRRDGQVTQISVPFENLVRFEGSRLAVQALPGPFGARGTQWAEPDKPHYAATGGLSPSVTNPQFAQQMTYAVSSWTLARFRRALGREPDFAFEGRLLLQPNAMEESNAYYDRELQALRFGWFRQRTDTTGNGQQGSLVCTALSHDIIVHEMSHALLDGQRSHLLLPTNPDVLALHEGFSDLIALFAHFTHTDIVHAAIVEERGRLNDKRLSDIGRQFGAGIGKSGPLRTSLLDPANEDSDRLSPINYANTMQPHDRGSLLLSAVFEAFRSVYLRKTEKWRSAVEGIPTLSSHPLLYAQLTKTASQLAEQFLNIIIRALDYLPPVDVDFGEFLRAMITADHEMVPDDPWQYREALIYAFRRYGIPVNNVQALDETELLWHSADKQGLKCGAIAMLGLLPFQQMVGAMPVPQLAADHVRRFLMENSNHLGRFGLAQPRNADEQIRIESLRRINRISPSGELMADFCIELLQWRQEPGIGWFPGGCTLIVGVSGEMRYVIWKNISSESRTEAARHYLDGAGLRHAGLFQARDPAAVTAAAAQALRALHQPNCC